MGSLENSVNHQEVIMSTHVRSIDTKRVEVHTRLRRRQRIVIALDHSYTLLFYVSALVATVAATSAIVSGTVENLWGVMFAVLTLPHLFDASLTALMFGRAFDRDHDLLLSLEAEELAALSR